MALTANLHPVSGDHIVAKSLIDKTNSPGELRDNLSSSQSDNSAKADAQYPPLEQTSNAGSHKAKETLNLLATAILPIVGALGTLSVFLIANFYVGDVEVTAPHTFSTLEVHAYNKKGQEAVFHSPRFQLMPDDYHFEIAVDSRPKQHADAAVRFRERTLVQVSQPAASPSSDPTTANIAKKKHWWQVWKKAQDENKSSSANQQTQPENQAEPKAKND